MGKLMSSNFKTSCLHGPSIRSGSSIVLSSIVMTPSKALKFASLAASKVQIWIKAVIALLRAMELLAISAFYHARWCAGYIDDNWSDVIIHLDPRIDHHRPEIC